jgi:predicted DNA-binding antitoxin AbrB/MazE fold protein
MTRAFDAIFENGLLKPLEDVDLPEGRLLRVVIEDQDEKSRRPDRRESFRRFRESVEQGSFYLKGKLPTRDELQKRSIPTFWSMPATSLMRENGRSPNGRWIPMTA